VASEPATGRPRPHGQGLSHFRASPRLRRYRCISEDAAGCAPQGGGNVLCGTGGGGQLVAERFGRESLVAAGLRDCLMVGNSVCGVGGAELTGFAWWVRFCFMLSCGLACWVQSCFKLSYPIGRAARLAHAYRPYISFLSGDGTLLCIWPHAFRGPIYIAEDSVTANPES
jgi:hypothetical protein